MPSPSAGGAPVETPGPTSTTHGTPAPGAPQDVYLVLAGGASLGSYEAGYAATFLQFLRENRELFTLRGISGTSAGGINAIAGGLEYCRADAAPDRDRSVNYDAWMPISWQMLYDPDAVSAHALFHHDALREHGHRVLDPTRYPLRSDCNVAIQVAVTQTMNARHMRDAKASAAMVEYIGVELHVRPDGSARYMQMPPAADQSPRRVALLAGPDGEVSPDEVFNMILATSAIPAGLPPVRMEVLEATPANPHAPRITSPRLYYDGGIFENVPVQSVLPFLQDAQTPAPLVMIVDLDSGDVPATPPQRPDEEAAESRVTSMASTWLRYARARDYAASLLALESLPVETRRARQRYPVTGEFLSQLAAFFDRNFRRTDYALGVRDAQMDLDAWGARTKVDTRRSAPMPDDHCIAELIDGELSDDETLHGCDARLPAAMRATLRALAAAAAHRCDAQAIPSMACARVFQEDLRGRLAGDHPPTRRERRLRNAPGRAPTEDFQAFLEELRVSGFRAELADGLPRLRASARARPELVWSRLLEDAIARYADAQPTSHLRAAIALEAMLASALPALPRPVFSGLLNLNGLEAAVQLPLTHKLRLDLGATAEWGLPADRAKGWHVLAAGPVMRLGWSFARREALISTQADVHAGVLFGPVLPGVADGTIGPGQMRGISRPNAAVFLGVAPRFVLLRRLQIDLPLRVYWLCDTPACRSFASRTPAYAISLRIGWSWTIGARIRPAARD